MSLPVFVHPGTADLAVGGTARLEGDEGRHAVAVRRLRVGERLVLTDGAGAWAEVEITATEKAALSADVVEVGTRPVEEPRVTVATVVYDGGRYLLVEERAEEGRAVLNQPAGHLEPGESLAEAARRETLEESGWEVEIEAVLGASLFSNRVSGLTYYRTSFLAR